MMAAIHLQLNKTKPKKPADEREAPDLGRWSIQGIRRIPERPARHQIDPAHVIIIVWSLWRRGGIAFGGLRALSEIVLTIHTG